MRQISNSHAGLTIMNIDPGEVATKDRGPFIIIQRGFAPEDSTMTEWPYVLLRDQSWIRLAMLVSGDDDLLGEALFTSMEEAMQSIESLPGKITVRTGPLDLHKMQAHQQLLHDREAHAAMIRRVLEKLTGSSQNDS